MMKRTSNSLRILLAHGAEQGIPATKLLENSGLAPSNLDRPDLLVDAGQELAVLANLVNGNSDALALGFALGNRYQLTSYGIFGYALLASPTIRKAVEFGLRFVDLTYLFTGLDNQETDTSFSLTVTPKFDGPLGQAATLRDIVAIHVIISDLLPGQNLPFSLELTDSLSGIRQLPGYAAFAAHFAGGVRFGHMQNRFVAPVTLLDIPLPKADESTVMACITQCQSQLLRIRRHTGISGQLRDLLVQHHTDLTLDQAAHHVGKTSRSLHRQLRRENTSWRLLKDELRMDLARELLTQPIKMEEIAERLGFHDAASFSNSFKRCTGLSPRQYRDSRFSA